MNLIGTWSLTGPTATAIIVVSLLISGVLVVSGLRRRARGTILALALASMVGVGAWLYLNVLVKPFSDGIATALIASCALALAAAFSVVTQKGGRGWMVVALILSIPAAAGVGNLCYQLFPTVRSLNPEPVAVAMDFAAFRQASTASTPPTQDGREVGALVSLPLAGDQSGVRARDALVYVPPAYWTHPETDLPVLVLMHGNPGEPSQWFDAGEAGQSADEYQATHDGVSPIVVSVDATGSLNGNPICVDGPELNMMTYLSADVPAGIEENFRVDEDRAHWVIGGLSYGGTCALQIMTTHPGVYGSFLDFSGEAEPGVGEHQATVDQFFAGDEESFAAVNPEDILQNAVDTGATTFRDVHGVFVAGEKDHSAQDAQARLSELANRAGMVTTTDTTPGSHTFEVWRTALRENFEWAAARGGL